MINFKALKFYVVKFFKYDKEEEKDVFLGSVEIDDFPIGDGISLMAKAFRQAPTSCLYSDKVRLERR
jgi:hypothetical protein